MTATAPEKPLESNVSAKRSLAGLDRAGLAAALSEIGVPAKAMRMRVEQLFHWIYLRGITDFAEMANISKDLRVALAARFTLDRPEIAVEQVSVDGTRKWLLRLTPDRLGQRHEIECVYIPEEGRGTLCVSAQIGCTLTCSFCHTGTQRLVRNLTAAEIVGQLLVARDRLGDWPQRSVSEGMVVPFEASRFVTNIVFMGMGEPLYNIEEVERAISVLCDGDGLSISRRKITVSTSGVVPEISRLGANTGAMLAISLHATNDPLRDVLVPLNKKYPLRDLLEACRTYPGASNARRITFEYVMLAGVNDTPAEARQLVRLLKGIPAKINLIPFNPWPGTRYACSDWDTIERFSQIVFDAGYSSPVRTPRGRDILAACGQLKSESQRLTIKERERLAALATSVSGIAAEA